MSFFAVLSLSFLVAQAEAPSTEPFNDPFSNPEATETQLPEPPADAPAAETAPTAEPSSSTIESQPSESVPAEAAAPIEPPKEFKFPEQVETGGPVSQDFLQTRMNESETAVGTFSLFSVAGLGLNVNRRPQQGHFEVGANYRLTQRFELGLSSYVRFVSDKLLGFQAKAAYFFELTRAPSLRMELAPFVASGWVLRAPKSSFTEGRFPIRIGTDYLVYMNPKLAIQAGLSVETFLFGITSKGKSQNYLTSKGPPTQVVLVGGVRYQF